MTNIQKIAEKTMREHKQKMLRRQNSQLREVLVMIKSYITKNQQEMAELKK